MGTVITTDRRAYHLSLTSSSGAAMASLSWTYPQDALIAYRRAAAEAEAAAPVAEGLQLEALRFDYAISGDRPAWRPLRAFDNGRQTFIEFPASLVIGEAPPLFLVDARGEAQLVNYRQRGRFYVVDRIFDAAERIARSQVCGGLPQGQARSDGSGLGRARVAGCRSIHRSRPLDGGRIATGEPVRWARNLPCLPRLRRAGHGATRLPESI